MISKWLRRIVVLAAALIAGALLAEIVVRIGHFDERFLERHAYRQGAYPMLHEEWPQVDLLYRLKAGATLTENGKQFSINSRHARAPERAAQKAAGVFRIVVVGGSNVFGTDLDDADTWPAQLEQQLAAKTGAAIEVWNFGTPAYVPTQMVAIAREARGTLDPDLLLFAFSNTGVMAFPDASSVRRYYRRYPVLWKEQVFSEEQWRGWDIVPPAWQAALLRHSHAYRLLPLAQIARHRDDYIDRKNQEFETLNVERFRAFAGECASGPPIAVFNIPWVTADQYRLPAAARYTRDLDIPVLNLTADGLPEEYSELHPGPQVMRWYAENLVTWLLAQPFAERLRGE